MRKNHASLFLCSIRIFGYAKLLPVLLEFPFLTTCKVSFRNIKGYSRKIPIRNYPFAIIDIFLNQAYIRLGSKSVLYSRMRIDNHRLITTMRIAISGTHFSGKSSLVEVLSEVLPDYTTVDEPYHLLSEEGYEFAESPSIEDFELMLERSVENLSENVENVIFDRCPADILGYLLSHIDAETFDLAKWLPRIQSVMRKLDLIVFLPIEKPDRIVLPSSEDAEFRQLVDEKLREIILENSFHFEVDILEVTGNLQKRVEQVLTHIRNTGV